MVKPRMMINLSLPPSVKAVGNASHLLDHVGVFHVFDVHRMPVGARWLAPKILIRLLSLALIVAGMKFLLT